MTPDPDEEHGLEHHTMWAPLLIFGITILLVAFAAGIILATALINHH